MAAFRFLASLFALVAVVALVIDATPAWNGTGPFETTSVIGHWKELAPGSLEAARKALSQSAPAWVWDTVILSILNVPTFVLFGLLAVLCGYFGRHRHQLKVHIN
jgi:hypothetical protein